MTVFIALLRGINVGGHRKMPMAGLRDLVEAAGFISPATYVQSGNLVLEARGYDRPQVEEILQSAIAERFGFDVPVVARDLTQWREVIRANPFTKAETTPTALHAFVLSQPADSKAEERLAARERVDEAYALVGEALYLSTPSGIGRSKFAAAVERLLGVPATARNWNTVVKLEAMAAELSSSA